MPHTKEELEVISSVIPRVNDYAVGIVGRTGIVAEFFENIRGAYEGASEEARANAYLFTASKDLLAVVEETIALYGKPGGPWNIPSDPGGWLARAQAAVKKAKNEI